MVHADLVDLGVIGGHKRRGHRFSRAGLQLWLRHSLAQIQTEQRRLSIERELEAARQIQSATLPRELPRLCGISIAARYLPLQP